MSKVVINLTAGPEDGEAATIAYLVGTAAQAAGNDVLFFVRPQQRTGRDDAAAERDRARGRRSLGVDR